jgi:hypothetical protein
LVEKGGDEMPTTLRPGQKAPVSGIYSPTKGGAEVAISKGDRVPPTKQGGGFVLKVPTKK